MVMLSFGVSHDSITDKRSRDDEINCDRIVTILWFSVSEHSKHRNVEVDDSKAKMISAEYELQDCCHCIWTEMQIDDDEVSLRVEN